MAAEGPVSMSAAGRRICSVCCQAVAAYTCPRCHKAYCTSACYKQHGHQCTEAFYREQATSQMKATRADAQQTQQMMRILQRMHQQGDLEQQQHGGSSGSGSELDSEDGSDDEAGTAAAAAGLDKWLAESPEFQQLLRRAAAEGDAFEVSPADLSAELADRLGALALSGRLRVLLQPWKPWWTCPAAAQICLNPSGQRVIAEVMAETEIVSQQQSGSAAAESRNDSSSTAKGDARDEGFAPLPEPPKQPLPSLVQLAGANFKPSPLLPFELLQLLVAYCAVLHYWNGEPDCGAASSSSSGSDGECCWEAAEQLLLLAPPLEQQAARLAGSCSSSRVQQAQLHSQQEGRQPLQQQQQQVADSIRCACMQLADAAAASSGELQALLQQATADALALLQLGRSAVLLALTDSQRLLERGRRNLKHQRLQQKQQPGGRSGGKNKPTLQQHTIPQQQQQVLLEQQLKLACRKLTFFQVWCNEQEPALYQQLSLQLDLELREQQAMKTPAATGIRLGVQPVQAAAPARQQQPQQQPAVAEVLREVLDGGDQAVAALVHEDAAAAATAQQQQQQEQEHMPRGAVAALSTVQQQQEQQQPSTPQDVGSGSSVPTSDLYELD